MTAFVDGASCIVNLGPWVPPSQHLTAQCSDGHYVETKYSVLTELCNGLELGRRDCEEGLSRGQLDEPEKGRILSFPHESPLRALRPELGR